jgi:hypothetical protein
VAVGVAVAVLVAVAVEVSVAVAVAVGVAVAVAVAVGVGTAPNAIPLKFTVWDAVLPSSAIVSFPVSTVPAGLVSVVGLNVKDTWQLPPAEIDDPHEFAVTSNGSGAPIDETSKGSMFGLVIVTLLVAETDPTCTRPNASDVGENVGLARIPVPSSVTDWGLFAASSVILKFPLRAPVWVGLNVTSMAQVALGARS